jgi:Uma2 family endonuclease
VERLAKRKAIAMTLAITQWSIEDYHRMIDAGVLEGRQVELLNGKIVDMPPEGTPHAHLSDEAADYLRELLRGRAKIREAKPITLSDNSEPQPDIAIVQPLGDEYFEHHPYPENIFWLIEFSDSSLSKDLETKSKIYAAAGINEYWVINLKQRKLIIFRSPTDEGYEFKQTLNEGAIAPFAFQDVQISVQRLLKSGLQRSEA